MKTAAVRKIALQISKRYGMPKPIVENVIGQSGDKQIEIRSELTSYDGGNELCDAISKLDNTYICEYYGGCVYRVYQLQFQSRKDYRNFVLGE